MEKEQKPEVKYYWHFLPKDSYLFVKPTEDFVENTTGELGVDEEIKIDLLIEIFKIQDELMENRKFNENIPTITPEMFVLSEIMDLEEYAAIIRMKSSCVFDSHADDFLDVVSKKFKNLKIKIEGKDELKILINGSESSINYNELKYDFDSLFNENQSLLLTFEKMIEFLENKLSKVFQRKINKNNS